MNLKRLSSFLLGAMMLVPTAFAMDPPERGAYSLSLTFEQQDEDEIRCRHWCGVWDEVEKNKDNPKKISHMLKKLNEELKILDRSSFKEVCDNRNYLCCCILVCNAYFYEKCFLSDKISKEKLDEILGHIADELLKILGGPYYRMEQEFVDRVTGIMML